MLALALSSTHRKTKSPADKPGGRKPRLEAAFNHPKPARRIRIDKAGRFVRFAD
jgi:hypothetical protein